VVKELRERIVIARISGRADTAQQGAAVHQALQAVLSRPGSIDVDFQGITTATSSFTNLAFVQLLTKWGLQELKHRLRVVNSTRQINEMIKSRLEREGNNAAA
jgi:STAS-like domain of unknown function (DUF4325)